MSMGLLGDRADVHVWSERHRGWFHVYAEAEVGDHLLQGRGIHREFSTAKCRAVDDLREQRIAMRRRIRTETAKELYTCLLTVSGATARGFSATEAQQCAHAAGRRGQSWTIHDTDGRCVSHDGRHGERLSSKEACDAFQDALDTGS